MSRDNIQALLSRLTIVSRCLRSHRIGASSQYVQVVHRSHQRLQSLLFISICLLRRAMLNSPVFPTSITVSVSLYSTSCDSLSEAFEAVLGVDRTWALPLCISSSLWELLLAVFWVAIPGSATVVGAKIYTLGKNSRKSELLIAVVGGTVFRCRSCCNLQMLE